ncbi:hypothetical protein [Neomegalonema sp.]|uniref:hypothetical protein n=1 Tax=Neomegalonema sp. TaxID=2039713 RepID=UPI00262CD128|nr:hypothetical protein [Neomegalonema sp.]MDD2869216.1 hypothetical protein [Neomegalonema sp.]
MPRRKPGAFSGAAASAARREKAATREAGASDAPTRLAGALKLPALRGLAPDRPPGGPDPPPSLRACGDAREGAPVTPET